MYAARRAQPGARNPLDNIAYQDFSPEERSHPYTCFRNDVSFDRLTAFTETWERNPRNFNQIHPALLALSLEYRNLYAQNPLLKTPVQEPNFANVLREIRRRRTIDPTATLTIILFGLACQKPPPGDEYPGDPNETSLTHKFCYALMWFISFLFGIWSVAVNVGCPCFGILFDGQQQRRGNLRRATEPHQRLMEISKLFLRLMIASLAYEGIRVETAIAFGGWAARLFGVRKLNERIDQTTFPHQGPAPLNCPVFCFFHPYPLTRLTHIFIRSCDFVRLAIVLTSLQSQPHRWTLEQVFNRLHRLFHTALYPIDTLGQVLFVAGVNSTDPLDVVWNAVCDAKDAHERENRGFFVTSFEGNHDGCGSESSELPTLTIMAKCYFLRHRGIETRTMEEKEVGYRFQEEVNRIELEEAGWEGAFTASREAVAAEHFLRKHKAYLLRNGIDLAGLSDTEILSRSYTISARFQLERAGIENVDRLSDGEARSQVHLLQRKTWLEENDIDTSGMSREMVHSEWRRLSKAATQQKRVALLIEEDHASAAARPQPQSSIGTSSSSAPPLNSANVSLPSGFKCTVPINQGDFEDSLVSLYRTSLKRAVTIDRKDGNNFAWATDLEAYFAPRLILELNRRIKDETAYNGAAMYQAFVRRDLLKAVLDVLPHHRRFKTLKGDDLVHKSWYTEIQQRFGGWKCFLKDRDLTLRLSPKLNLPENQAFRARLEKALAQSDWFQGDWVTCTKDCAKKGGTFDSAEGKWLASLFMSDYWELIYEGS